MLVHFISDVDFSQKFSAACEVVFEKEAEAKRKEKKNALIQTRQNICKRSAQVPLTNNMQIKKRMERAENNNKNF